MEFVEITPHLQPSSLVLHNHDNPTPKKKPTKTKIEQQTKSMMLTPLNRFFKIIAQMTCEGISI